MNKKILFISGLVALGTIGADAQNDKMTTQSASERCAHNKQTAKKSLAKSTVASPLEDQYDVQYLKLDLSVDNQNNDIDGNAFTRFYREKPMTGLVIDPEEWLLRGIGDISQDINLDIVDISKEAIKVYPNPASDSWNIGGLTTGSRITVKDISGRPVFVNENITAPEIIIPATNYATGMYLLSIIDAKGNISNLKLIKR